MIGIGIPTASITSTIDLLSSRHPASVHRVPVLVPHSLEEFEPEEILVDDTLQQEIPEAKPAKRSLPSEGNWRTLGFSSWEAIRRKSDLSQGPVYSPDTTCQSPARRIRSYCTGSAPVSVCPASTTRGSGTLEKSCPQRARSSRCVVSARKQGLWTELEEVRVRLSPRRLQTKIDQTGEKA